MFGVRFCRPHPPSPRPPSSHHRPSPRRRSSRPHRCCRRHLPFIRCQPPHRPWLPRARPPPGPRAPGRPAVAALRPVAPRRSPVGSAPAHRLPLAISVPASPLAVGPLAAWSRGSAYVCPRRLALARARRGVLAPNGSRPFGAPAPPPSASQLTPTSFHLPLQQPPRIRHHQLHRRAPRLAAAGPPSPTTRATPCLQYSCGCRTTLWYCAMAERCPASPPAIGPRL